MSMRLLQTSSAVYVPVAASRSASQHGGVSVPEIALTLRVNVKEGQLTMAMPASGWLSNARGVMYGGAIAWFADATMSLATLTTIPAATAFGPLDLKIHFLRPVLPSQGELTARATVVHRGRTIAVTECEIFDPQQKLAARAMASQLVLPGRPWDRPLHVEDEFTTDSGRAVG